MESILEEMFLCVGISSTFWLVLLAITQGIRKALSLFDLPIDIEE